MRHEGLELSDVLQDSVVHRDIEIASCNLRMIPDYGLINGLRHLSLLVECNEIKTRYKLSRSARTSDGA